MPTNTSTQPKKLFTSGYEGQNIDDFICELKKNHIDVLVDIREIPISRKKGFSKKALTSKLQEKNIQYVHFKKLGSPSDIRKKVRADKNYPWFFSRFQEYLAEQNECLQAVLDLAQKSTCCLLCFEKDPEICHRFTVAEKLFSMNNIDIQIEHL